MAKVSERVPFRLLNPACCGALICWVNPRLPMFCPECGQRCYPEIRAHVLLSDDTAMLRVDEEIVLALAQANRHPKETN
jgi:hypothetical protein